MAPAIDSRILATRDQTTGKETPTVIRVASGIGIENRDDDLIHLLRHQTEGLETEDVTGVTEAVDTTGVGEEGPRQVQTRHVHHPDQRQHQQQTYRR